MICRFNLPNRQEAKFSANINHDHTTIDCFNQLCLVKNPQEGRLANVHLNPLPVVKKHPLDPEAGMYLIQDGTRFYHLDRPADPDLMISWFLLPASARGNHFLLADWLVYFFHKQARVKVIEHGETYARCHVSICK